MSLRLKKYQVLSKQRRFCDVVKMSNTTAPHKHARTEPASSDKTLPLSLLVGYIFDRALHI